MVLRDLIITPVLIIVILVIAFFIRERFSDKVIKKYFIPGLSIKILGAVAIGFVYQYYYGGGDTFTYFEHGSQYIYEAFQDSPIKAFKLIFANGEYTPDTFKYATKIVFYKDLPSYFVIRVAGFFDLFTFHTYSATAVLFALLSFSGLWALYLTFYRMFPKLHLQFAIAVLFVPSVFFWGSGILKDPLTLGALGWATWAFYEIFFRHKNLIISILVFIISAFVIYSIKIYILLCFVPGLLIWLYMAGMKRVKNPVLKAMVVPVAVSIALFGMYFSIIEIGENNKRYNIENVTYTAEATARWLTFVSEREGGSSYSLGDFDYSPAGMARKAHKAVWVTLFRPYLWEVKNSVMLFSAIESLLFLILTLYILVRSGPRRLFKYVTSSPVIIFCLTFSIVFSFAVGISTYNFGSLVRYKIPMIPFYLAGLFILQNYVKRSRKAGRLVRVEY